MSRNNDVYGLPSLRVVIEAGGIAKIGPFPGQLATSIKLISGGTLEIGGYSLSPISTMGVTMIQGTGAFVQGNTFGQMYPLASNEVFSGNISGSFYLYASGATCVVAIAVGRSMGFEG